MWAPARVVRWKLSLDKLSWVWAQIGFTQVREYHDKTI